MNLLFSGVLCHNGLTCSLGVVPDRCCCDLPVGDGNAIPGILSFFVIIV